MALCSLAFWLLALFAAWAVEGQENGRGELHAVVECFVPSNDASAKPLQLISHLVDFVDENHHRQDRRDIALMYLPFFAGQMWFLGSYQNGMVPLPGIHSYYACSVYDHFYYHTCLGDLFEKLLLPPPEDCTSRIPFSGVLFHHLECAARRSAGAQPLFLTCRPVPVPPSMWVNPYRMLNASGPFVRTSAWFPEMGLPGNSVPADVEHGRDMGRTRHTCLEGDALKADCEWGWCDKDRDFKGQLSMQEEGLVALAALSASGQLHAWPPGRLCRGHSDIFYLPHRYFSTFGRLVQAFNRTFHEVAVPTIIQMCLWEEGTRDAFVHTQCDGSCCERAGDDLLSYNCAHRLDLRNRTVRELVINALLT